MNNPQGHMKNISKDDGYISERPMIELIGEQHWFYLQKKYHMSPRELEVAKLVCQGLNNEQIARNLNIKHGTAKTHIRNIYRRIRVKNKISMLLKFVNDIIKFSAKPGTNPPTAIVGIDKTSGTKSAPFGVVQKEQ